MAGAVRKALFPPFPNEGSMSEMLQSQSGTYIPQFCYCEPTGAHVEMRGGVYVLCSSCASL